MPLTDPALPPEERKKALLAIGSILSPMHPLQWNEIANEWNQIVEGLGEPPVSLIDYPPEPLQSRSGDLNEILQRALRQET